MPPRTHLRRLPYAVSGAVLAALSLAAALAGCSGDGDDAAASPTAAATTASTPASTPPPSFAPAGPVTFRVLSGATDGAIDIEQFMPADIHVREGDSVEWTAHGYEGHTVTFGSEEHIKAVMDAYLQPDPADPEQSIFNPDFALARGGDVVDGSGEYVNSGFIGVPSEAKFTLTFTQRGVYQYLCVVHPLWMRGTVSVDAPDADVESPEAVTARGQEDLQRFMAVAKREVAEASEVRRSVPGPDGTSVHHVAVGLNTPHGQIATYVPAGLSIKAGDTVIFESDDRNFHNVIFKGAQPEPPGYDIYIDPETGGINVALAKESAVAVDPPPAGFDDQAFLSSGSMGIAMPRSRWQLTFDKPGRYSYSCTIHAFAGMAGVIDVAPRQ